MKSILEAKTHYHADNPDTSKWAAWWMVKSGKMGKQCAFVVNEIKNMSKSVQGFNGFTSKELADWGDLDYIMIGKRLPDLEKAGLIHKSSLRRGGRVVWMLGAYPQLMTRESFTQFATYLNGEFKGIQTIQEVKC